MGISGAIFLIVNFLLLAMFVGLACIGVMIIMKYLQLIAQIYIKKYPADYMKLKEKSWWA